MGLTTRFKNAWNAFRENYPPEHRYDEIGYSYRPDRFRLTRGNERSIINPLYNRISLDVASIDFEHVQTDKNGRFLKELDTGLNTCLRLAANKDQDCRSFIQDVVLSMFDEGCVGIVPIDTSSNPRFTDAYDIGSMRVGKITSWYPDSVTVLVYNDRTGEKEEMTLPKRCVAIIENPFYSVMNEPSSALARLKRKIAILDAIDEQSFSGKLDLIIQIPYSIKTPIQQKRAEDRQKAIENQLEKSQHGIAFIDSTEKIIQLNRPIDNNLMAQIEYLTNSVQSQLGINQSILDGTADEKTMLNYYNRTVEPIVSAIVLGLRRTFISPTARTQGKTIMAFRDPFKLVPVSEIAEIADKFTRNEIASTNEIRQVIGWKPSDDPKADELRNKNLSPSKGEEYAETNSEKEE